MPTRTVLVVVASIVVVAACASTPSMDAQEGSTYEVVMVAPSEAMLAAGSCRELGAVMGRSFDEVITGWADGGYFPEVVVGEVGTDIGKVEVIDLSELPPFPLRSYHSLSILSAYYSTSAAIIAAKDWRCDPAEVADAFVGSWSERLVEQVWPRLQVDDGAPDLGLARDRFVEYLELVADQSPTVVP